jgi:chromosome segregation ATPase
VIWLIDKITGLIGVNAAALAFTLGTLVFGVYCGWRVTAWCYQDDVAEIQAEFATARQGWETERQTALAQALAASESRRVQEQTFTEQLAQAVQEADHAKTRIARARADSDRTARQLRDARAAIAAAANRRGEAPAAACFRAADITVRTVGECATQYRNLAHQYGECLAGMQLIEKTWNAARDLCR